MLQPIFQFLHGLPVPKLPRLDNQPARKPDGETWFGLEETANRMGMDANALREWYAGCFADLTRDDETPVVDAGDPIQSQRAASDRVLRQVRLAHLTSDQADLLIETCRQYGLNPWSRHIHLDSRPTPRGRNEITVVVTIDALRALAEQTKQYGGRIGPYWCGDEGEWREVWVRKEPPKAARVGIIRRGFDEPLWAVAQWEFYAQIGEDGQPTDFWRRGPDHMLAKCCEALALRAAFPEKLGSLYTREEMMQASNPRPPAPTTTPRTVPGNPQDAALPVMEEELPDSQFQFELRLVDLGYGNLDRRVRLIQEFKGKYPTIYARDRKAFYGTVLRDLAARPVPERVQSRFW